PIFFTAYKSLKSWKGDAQAFEFAKKEIPAEKLDSTSWLMIDSEAYDLLWSLYPKPEDTKHPEWIWLMRAIAAVKTGDKSHQQELTKYYDQHKTLPEEIQARYLLGMISEKEFLANAKDPRSRSDISYYIGLKAQSEGRYMDASDWYRVCKEADQYKSPIPYGATGPHFWAESTLYNWTKEKKTLAQIQADATHH
ncbi:MAG TPA: hypothetical protein VFG11_10450, partial [Acidobacteriota bacterium]|nr:hypothetical protein [Acidobacteriota bacterium]